MKTALLTGVLDIEQAGDDGSAGLGIVRPGPGLATITAGPKIAPQAVALVNESFTPANSAPDPGEQITVSLGVKNNGATPTTNLTATLLAIFAGLALVITAAGLAGLMAFSVSQRTQEIGVRMALGAARSEVLGMILRQGLRLVCIGLVLGAAGALAFSRLMAGLLFGIRPTDAATFALTGVVLLIIATLACLVPARRASTVDPMVALRTT